MLLYQNIDGYCYNSDTLFLYNFISKFKPRGDFLDIGSGCGILGLLLKRDFDITLTQIDIQKENCFLNEQNSKVNNLSSNILHDNFLEHNFSEKFDFIVSNPPYYDKNLVQSQNKSVNISRYNQHLPIDSFFARVSANLNHRGNFIFCYDAKQIQDIIYFSKKYKLNIETLRFVHSNENKESSLMQVQTKKDSQSKTTILPPLIISQKAKEIYQKTRTYSIKCKIK